MAGERSGLKIPALDPASLPVKTGNDYPAPFAAPAAARHARALGEALGLTNFGVNVVRLEPGTMSSQRHWHSRQDEFVYVLEGQLVLVTDSGEQTLTPGMAAGFPAASGDGHHLINRTSGDATYLVVGDRAADDEVDYPDIDMLVRWVDGRQLYVRKDGTPYQGQ